MSRARALAAVLVSLLTCTSMSHAQSLDEQLDEERFLRGLSELNLPEVLQRYVELHPPADAVRSAEFQSALDRMSLREPGLTIHERETIVRSMLQRRDELLRDLPDHPKRLHWLTEQASDIYFELLTIDASGIMAHLGLASAEQRERASNAVAFMLEYAREAEIAVEQAMLDLESTPGFKDNIALQLQRRRMAEDQRDRRVPFLHGIAAYLHATWNLQTDAQEQRRHYALALRLLEPLGNRLHAPLNHHARLYAAFAATRTGQHDDAERLFMLVRRSVIDDRLLSAMATIGLARNTADRGRASDAMRELDEALQQFPAAEDLFYRLLIADARFRIGHANAMSAPARERDRVLAETYAAYVALIDAADAPLPPDRMRDVVFSRLVRAADASTPVEQLPPIAAIAQASHMAQSQETRDEAIFALQQLVEQTEMAQGDAALAIYMLAKAHHAAGENLDAAQWYIELARKHPYSRDAERAIELGAALAAEVHRAQPRTAAPVLREALQVLLHQYPNLQSVDRWRFAAGQIALDQRLYDEALDHFKQVAADSPHIHDALFMQARTLLLAAREADDAYQRTQLHQRIRETVNEVRPRLMRSMGLADDIDQANHLRSNLAALHVIEAEALLRLNQPQQALNVIEGMDESDDLEGRIIAEALQVRIEAYRALGQAPEAQRELDRFIAAAPRRVGQVLTPWMSAIQRDVVRLLENHQQDQAMQLARSELAPLAERLEQWINTSPHGTNQRDALRPRIADAYRYSGRFEQALALYEPLLAEYPAAVQYVFGRAECLYHLAGEDDQEQLGEAMVLFRRIASAGIEVGEVYFWQSHVRTLQILDRIGRNTQQIVPQIQRLRQIDRELGGSRYRRQFDQLQNKYS